MSKFIKTYSTLGDEESVVYVNVDNIASIFDRQEKTGRAYSVIITNAKAEPTRTVVEGSAVNLIKLIESKLQA